MAGDYDMSFALYTVIALSVSAGAVGVLVLLWVVGVL